MWLIIHLIDFHAVSFYQIHCLGFGQPRAIVEDHLWRCLSLDCGHQGTTLKGLSLVFLPSIPFYRTTNRYINKATPAGKQCWFVYIHLSYWFSKTWSIKYVGSLSDSIYQIYPQGLGQPRAIVEDTHPRWYTVGPNKTPACLKATSYHTTILLPVHPGVYYSAVLLVGQTCLSIYINIIVSCPVIYLSFALSSSLFVYENLLNF